MMRIAELKRETRETKITISLNLDGTGQNDIITGLGLLDHMLAHVAVHGLFDLSVRAEGDLDVDPHHTVEDVGLVFGSVLDQALGDRKGIVRMSSAYVPMDEVLGFVTIDLSGRPFSVVDVNWTGSSVGGISVTLWEHFFASFAVTARANLHARVLYGRDDHHKAEALFKALARALDEATRIDPRRKDVPSTKGVIEG